MSPYDFTSCSMQEEWKEMRGRRVQEALKMPGKFAAGIVTEVAAYAKTGGEESNSCNLSIVSIDLNFIYIPFTL